MHTEFFSLSSNRLQFSFFHLAFILMHLMIISFESALGYDDPKSVGAFDAHLETILAAISIPRERGKDEVLLESLRNYSEIKIEDSN